MTIEFLGNIKGPKGDAGERGAQGLPGMNAVPTDEAVAGYLGTPGASASKTAMNAAVQAALAELQFSVKAFGAVGDGVADDTAAIQACLDAAAGVATVLFPFGDYNVSARVRVPAGSKIMGYGATIHRTGTVGMLFCNWPVAQDSSPGAPGTTTGYNGWGDITLQGLTFDQHGDTNTNNSNTVTFGHARNITVRDCRFLRTVGYHALEINAVDGFMVDNCSFEGFLYKAGLDEKEAIQIDCATPGDSGAADDTMARNGVVQGCQFIGYQGMPAHDTAIGSHTKPSGRFYDNITVRDCVVNGAATRAVNARGWRNSLITGVKATTIGHTGIRVYQSERVSIIGNEAINCSMQGISVTQDSLDCVVQGNTINNTVEGVYIGSGSGRNVVAGNNIRRTSSYGITVNAASNNLIQGNLITGPGWASGALGAIRLTDADGEGILNSVVGNRVVRHVAGTEVSAGVSIAAGVTGSWVFGNDFSGLAVAVSGTANTDSNRI